MDYSPEQRARIAEHFRTRMRSCVPWSRNQRWAPELNIVADSYPKLDLFPEVGLSTAPPGEVGPGEFIDSSGGSFRYLNRLHLAGKRLETWWGRKLGDVLFDGPIVIPCLFERDVDTAGQSRWRAHPWMSITPAELITLRPGTKLAKGKVIIGGLGLAWQLLAVARRHAVKEIVVVERSHELCDLIMPRVMPLIGQKLTVIIGDAFRVIPTLTADVALVDTFPTYGDNLAATEALARRCKNIDRVWGWGAHDG